MFPTNKVAGAHKDELWSLREDLHTRFDATVAAYQIDALLDHVAADFDREGGIGAFRKVLIEREVVSQLKQGVNLDHLFGELDYAA